MKWQQGKGDRKTFVTRKYPTRRPHGSSELAQSRQIIINRHQTGRMRASARRALWGARLPADIHIAAHACAVAPCCLPHRSPGLLELGRCAAQPEHGVATLSILVKQGRGLPPERHFSAVTPMLFSTEYIALLRGTISPPAQPAPVPDATCAVLIPTASRTHIAACVCHRSSTS